jgi:allantoinase
MRADLRIEDGTIAAIEPELSGTTTIDATGLHVFPAVIDVHLHFNEPGRTEWEGAATGSRALAAGGGAVFFDMPLNSTPCTVNAREFDRNRTALEASSITDFGIWGGLIPGNLAEMAELADRGVVGFKAFLCDSGLPEFPRADDLTLWEGLAEAARLNLPVAVHAESQELTHELSRRLLAQGKPSIKDFLASRPVLAELEAIQRATLMAGETKARLHIVHISSGRGVVAAAEARARGVDVSIETCPHYLSFTDEDLGRLGALAKCAPPLRSREHQNELWAELARGTIDIVASDHSPAPPEMKTGDFHRAWGGIAGVQSTLPVLLDRGYFERGIPLEHIAGLLADTPARRFRIARKGAIQRGNDADLTLVDLAASFTLRTENMAHRHRISPYSGETFRGVVRRTIRRGETLFADGKFPPVTCGRLVRPEK